MFKVREPIPPALKLKELEMISWELLQNCKGGGTLNPKP